MNNNSKSKKEKLNTKNNLSSSINSTPQIQNINTNNIINQQAKLVNQKKRNLIIYLIILINQKN